MEELFIESEGKNLPIEPKMAVKYHLRKGTLSPFTIRRIVGKNGDFTNEGTYEEEPRELTAGDLDNEVFLTTSEAIDIAQGADSQTM